MPLISLNRICLAFGHHKLLEQSDLQLDMGERIALIGRNGEGKSSLLRIIADEIQPDDGNVWRAPAIDIAYVPQEPDLDVTCTVFEEVSKGLGGISQILSDYDEVSNLLSRAEGDVEEHLLRLQELQSTLDDQDGWRIQKRVEDTLLKLKLQKEILVESLSGGQRKRVALARALVFSPNVLLLDEPTNHLDFSSIEWLENLLNNFPGSVLFVTHDRRFLDNVATRIIEIDRGILTTFRCNFNEYLRKKSEIKEIEVQHNQKFNKVLANEEAWIRQGIKARRTRNEGRVRRLEALRIRREAQREQVAGVTLNISRGIDSGHMVAELTHVSKRYGKKLIISDFSCRIMRGDRVGLLGPNGAGKSTLLKLILKKLDPDTGTVRLGTKLTVAYFDQMREQLDEEATLIETISQGSDFIEIGKIRKHVVSYLGDFLFAPQRSRSLVKTLSGGERNRLLLARLFSRPANVLVLDEPTNDLDIETLELLEALLQDYEGTLFLVSHDRLFLDNVVTQVIVFEGGGILQEYIGGYEDWALAKNIAKEADKRELRSQKKDSHIVKSSKLNSKPRLSFNEVRELEILPSKIEILEQEQASIANKLSDSNIYRDSPDEMIKLKIRFASLEKEVTSYLTRWDELETKKLESEQDLHN
ncbi:MAG: ABC transporter ATP-binding protein [Nitrosomonadaceae bacterium]|nr:ABC transporter ATP-binding protein [Nitrosomonadaceae bacterium]|tara:strand:- start:2063 stop:3994 length:1932 start_codon:yes stop_codon:yes gene_type:complete